jgi:hypothetical protein
MIIDITDLLDDKLFLFALGDEHVEQMKWHFGLRNDKLIHSLSSLVFPFPFGIFPYVFFTYVLDVKPI